VKPTIVPASLLRYLTLPGRESADPFGLRGDMTDVGLSVRVVRLSHDPARSAHVHALSAEAVYVVEGQGTLWADAERSPLRSGDTVLIPAGTPHATLPDPDVDMLLVCFFPHPDLAANMQELAGPLT
jgi:quercetin dioxygenase-like cupin family protein